MAPFQDASKAPRSQAALCLGGSGNKVSLGSPGVSQMVIKCDEGFDSQWSWKELMAHGVGERRVEGGGM